MLASGGPQAGGVGEGSCKAHRGAAESSAAHIHNFVETAIITPPATAGPGAVIGSLQFSGVRSDHRMDEQTQGAAGDGWGTGGSGTFL